MTVAALHTEKLAYKGWVTFFFCAVFEPWWFQGQRETHTNHALMYGCAKTQMGIQGPLMTVFFFFFYQAVFPD